ncbi:MAG: hypothetical protein WBH08_11590 [Methanothrix sp.]|uniref:hypothetical protein n=1 Tax=Methanothrix sp. TaxID=90426 RepID=UPI003BB69458
MPDNPARPDDNAASQDGPANKRRPREQTGALATIRGRWATLRYCQRPTTIAKAGDCFGSLEPARTAPAHGLRP